MTVTHNLCCEQVVKRSQVVGTFSCLTLSITVINRYIEYGDHSTNSYEFNNGLPLQLFIYLSILITAMQGVPKKTEPR